VTAPRPPWPALAPKLGRGGRDTLGYKLRSGDEEAQAKALKAMFTAGGDLTAFAKSVGVCRRTACYWVDPESSSYLAPLLWARNRALDMQRPVNADDLLWHSCEQSLVIAVRRKRRGFEAEIAVDGEVLHRAKGRDHDAAVSALIKALADSRKKVA
jgi:hypothetical protein